MLPATKPDAAPADRVVTRTLRAGSFEVREQQYDPATRIPTHTHDYSELCILVRGAFTEELMGRAITYSPLACSYKPAEVGHAVDVSALGAQCIVVAVPRAALTPSPGRGRKSLSPGLLLHESTRVLATRVARELQHSDECSPLALEATAFELLAMAAGDAQLTTFGSRPAWLLRACERIRDEFLGELGLGDVAVSVGVPPTRLAQAFRRHAGCTIGEYIRRLRVRHARLLLRGDDLSLAGVGHRCGFYDQSHFTRLFRSYTGVTPSEYRARHRRMTNCQGRTRRVTM